MHFLFKVSEIRSAFIGMIHRRNPRFMGLLDDRRVEDRRMENVLWNFFQGEELIIIGSEQSSIKGLDDPEFGSWRKESRRAVAIEHAIVMVIEADALASVDTAERIADKDEIDFLLRGLSFEDRLVRIKAKSELLVEQQNESR